MLLFDRVSNLTMRGFLLPFPVAVRLSLKGKERAIHGDADAVVESNALPH